MIINQIAGGTSTSDATLTSGAQILSPYTAYSNDIKHTGTIPSKGAQTYFPSTSTQIISAGQYLSGDQTIQGSWNLLSKNIKNAVTIFNVVGNMLTSLYYSSSRYNFYPNIVYTGSGTSATFKLYAPGITSSNRLANLLCLFSYYYNGTQCGGVIGGITFTSYSDWLNNTPYTTIFGTGGAGYFSTPSLTRPTSEADYISIDAPFTLAPVGSASSFSINYCHIDFYNV